MSFSLANLVRGHAAQRPDQLAIVCDGRRLTFADLHERSSRVATALLEAGVEPGGRVGLLLRNCAEFYEAAFGASKIDASVIGLNWRLAAPELAAILADADPSVVLTEPELADLVPELPGVRVVVIGEDYEAWLAAAAPDDPELPSGPDHVTLQFYSSGTTGLPKGIMLTNENMSHSATMAREGFRMSPQSTNMVVSPLFHIGGAGYGLMAMTQGGTTVIMRDVIPARILETIEQERVTHTFIVPAVIQMLLDAPEAADHDLSSLQLISYGAAPMTEALLRRALDAFGGGFLGVYGMTETAGTVVALDPADHEPDGPRSKLLRSVGRPLPWLELRVADLETGEEAPPGVVGEILVRSGQNMKGYWNQPETTAQTLLPDGWLRTGDGAYRDEDGYVYLQDRIKDMIISGGENVYPAEVENAVADHPAVAAVAVIGVPHERWGETVKAVVVPVAGADVSAEDLIAFARTRLARYKCPTSVEFVDELPRTPTGKVLKKALREQYAVPAR
jgi:acyl-CoA synthetase (AMP-forming)/AMP-acid ligase II